MGKTIKMKKIKLDINNVVKKNLQEKKKEYLKESLRPLKKNKMDGNLFEQYLVISSNLVSEGYSFNEIERMLLEDENVIDKLKSKGNQVMGNVDYGKLFTDSMKEGAKEYAIKWILNALGFNQNLSTTIAQFFAGYDITDILKPFKDKSNCMQYAPKMLDEILEIVVRYVGGKMMNIDRNDYNWGGAGSVLLGNMFGEAIKESNISEVIGGKFCNAVHK